MSTYLVDCSVKLPPSNKRILANNTPFTNGTDASSSTSKLTWNLKRFFFIMNDIVCSLRSDQELAKHPVRIRRYYSVPVQSELTQRQIMELVIPLTSLCTSARLLQCSVCDGGGGFTVFTSQPTGQARYCYQLN